MRVDDAAVGELSEALRGNTALRTLKLQHNRQLTDVRDTAISSLNGLAESIAFLRLTRSWHDGKQHTHLCRGTG